MDTTAIHPLILAYVEGWKETDREKILSTLDPACVIIESHGPTYRGKDMVGRWIDSWFAPGNIVNSWDITSCFVRDDICFFEWIFECTSEGTRGGFEGASIAHIHQGKIAFLREYAMITPRYEWKG